MTAESTTHVLNSSGSDNQAIIDTAIASVQPTEIEAGKDYAFVVPSGAQVSRIDTESLLENPKRKKGVVCLNDAASFISYFQTHKSESSVIYANEIDGRIIGVLNDHSKDVAGWADFQTLFELRFTPEWIKWVSRNNRMLSQNDFAELIEDSVEDIVVPSGAEMLELAQTFEAKSSVNFRTANYLSSGQRQLIYDETIDARAGEKGEIQIPSRFELGIAPFVGSERFKLSARLRFRIREGSLTLGYVLDHPELVIKEAFASVLETIKTATGEEILLGRPR